MKQRDTGLDFFVRYAESRGALAERVPEGAVLVLPDELRQTLELPEEVGFTDDPEVSRDDGFVLLAPGHPILLGAAQSIFERGDVGWSRLLWPEALPPTPNDLEQKIRDEIHPDHGRVDVTAPPDSIHLLVVRVGALLTYRISVDEQVHELEEVWVASATGAQVPAALEDRLRWAASEPGAPEGVETSFETGVAAADALIQQRAGRRQAELARQTKTRLHDQLAVVDDYYRRVLESVEERRAKATVDRAPLLAAQAEATTTEWTRRRDEVADELRPTFEVKPIRLHVLCVPAYRTPTVVRRGERAYPLSALYLPIISSFLPPTCPTCGAAAHLVAGKARLGCRSCLVPSGADAKQAPAPPLDESPLIIVPPTAKSSVTPTAIPKREAPRKQPASVAEANRQSPKNSRLRSSGRVTPRGSSGRVTPKGSRQGETLARTGGRLAISFWESVALGERMNRRDVAPNSPIEALRRLYGTRGPAHVVGLRNGERLTGIRTWTVAPDDDGVAITSGELETTTGRDVPFAIYWRLAPTKVVEIESYPMARIGHMLLNHDSFANAMRERLGEFLNPPPKPSVDLDPAAFLLLRQSATLLGLTFAARCMAAWWYVTEGDGDLAATSTGASLTGDSLAAVIELIVAKRAGMRVTSNSVAARYSCPVEPIRKEARRLQGALPGSEIVGW